MTGEHSSRQYDADLETLRSKVLLMGGLVENQFHDAIASFRSGNAELAASVITADSGVNQLEVDLDDACLKYLRSVVRSRIKVVHHGLLSLPGLSG